MRRLSVIAASCGLALLLAGCQTIVKQAPVIDSLPLGPEAKHEPLAFERLVFDIRRGTEIGRYSAISGCSLGFGTGSLTWGTGRMNDSTIETRDIFFHQFRAQGFDVVGDPNQLFNVKDEASRATLAVAGRVTELQVGYCNSRDFWTGFIDGQLAEAYVNITWQLYDKVEGKIVAQMSSEGSYKLDRPNVDAIWVAINDAVAAAVGNLAATEDFRKALMDVSAKRRNAVIANESGDGMPKIANYQGPPVTIPRLARYDGNVQDYMEKIRSAAVTIILGGGHGSGYLISDNGLILTNQHVVGEAKLVKVRLIDGREVVGEVLRTHPVRDAALVLIEPQPFTPLPIRETSLGIGEEVFAIGTPLYQGSLDFTVTRGIVSALRKDKVNGLPIIQGDVSINSGNSGGPLVDRQGNLVGMTVATILNSSDGSKAENINLFIPIADALEKLNIRLTE